jgi:ATP-dependent Clp protease protease subunit
MVNPAVKKATSLDDLEAELFSPSKPYTISRNIKPQQTINLYISEAIGSPEQYVTLIDTLRNAHPYDTIFMYLNTPGGYLTTGCQILHAMRDCQARLITVLDGSVCSMGALIFLAANEFVVHDYCQLMFHNYSGGLYGKGHELASQLNADADHYAYMLQDICSPFLEPEEIEAILAGQDIWLNSDEVRQRLAVVVSIIDEEQKSLQLEAELAQEQEILKRIAAREKKAAKQAAKKSNLTESTGPR